MSNFQKHTSRNPLKRWAIQRFHRQVAALVARVARPGASLLDVGCGEGFVLHFLRQRLSHLVLHGVDMREEALHLAPRRHRSTSLLCAEACRLPFADGAFDVALCLEVLEHVPQPGLALEELKRVSAGHILISVPRQPFFSLANLALGKNWRTGGDAPDHIHRWTAPQFLAWAGERLAIEGVALPFPWVVVLGRARRDGSLPEGATAAREAGLLRRDHA